MRSLANWFGKKVEEWAEDNREVACLNGVVDGHLMRSETKRATEVKGCIQQYPSGRKGRVRLWKRQHQKLKELDGVYLIVVYLPDEDEPVQRDRFVHWTSVEYIMEKYNYSWYNAENHGMKSEQTQIPWSRFFDEM